MKWHNLDKCVRMKAPVATYTRGKKGKPRVFEINELDGLYVDNTLDRTVHIGFEEEDVVLIDIYDTAGAAYEPVGETLGIVELNIKTGKAKFFKEGR